jgi:hypothetical protein
MRIGPPARGLVAIPGMRRPDRGRCRRHPADHWAFLTDTAGAIALDGLDEDERRVGEETFEHSARFAGLDGIELPAVSFAASSS